MIGVTEEGAVTGTMIGVTEEGAVTGTMIGVTEEGAVTETHRLGKKLQKDTSYNIHTLL